MFPRWARSPLRGAAALLLALGALLAGSGPAAADDLFTLEDWFATHGYEEAWLEYDQGFLDGDGLVLTLFYAAAAETERGYRDEADRAAKEIWARADYRVVKVEVEGNRPTSWSGGDLPPTVSYSRSELERKFGPRRAGLDANGQAEVAGDFSGLPPPEFWFFAAGFAFLGLLLGGFVGWLATFLVLRRNRQPVVPYGTGWPQPGWQQPGGPPSQTPPGDRPGGPWTMGPGGSA
jgi:hypothetical protein